MEWQPIETAPKDGTRIDIWIVDEAGNGFRVPDAYWVVNAEGRAIRWDDGDGYRYIDFKRDGWFAPNFDYDGMDGFADAPPWFNAHSAHRKEMFRKATHWMPLPAPPVAECA